MARITTRLHKTCAYPNCQNQATLKINLTFVADYMAKAVCDDHADWAEEDIKRCLPTNRCTCGSEPPEANIPRIVAALAAWLAIITIIVWALTR